MTSAHLALNSPKRCAMEDIRHALACTHAPHMFTHAHTHTYTHIHAYAHNLSHARTQTHTHTHSHAHTHTHSHALTHAHTHAHAHTHTHTHTVCLCLPVFRSAVYHASSTPSLVGVSVGGTCPVDTPATGAATRGTVCLKRQSANNPAPICGRLVATHVLRPATQAGPVPAQCARRRSESA